LVAAVFFFTTFLTGDLVVFFADSVFLVVVAVEAFFSEVSFLASVFLSEVVELFTFFSGLTSLIVPDKPFICPNNLIKPPLLCIPYSY
jgi:hypothetical protein